MELIIIHLNNWLSFISILVHFITGSVCSVTGDERNQSGISILPPEPFFTNAEIFVPDLIHILWTSEPTGQRFRYGHYYWSIPILESPREITLLGETIVVMWRMYASVNLAIIGSDTGLSVATSVLAYFSLNSWQQISWKSKATICIQEDDFENIFGKMVVILSRPMSLYVDGLVQGRLNSIADALELRLSCTNPSI